MKFIYGIIKFVLAVAMIAFGVALFLYPFEEVYDFVHDYYLQLLEQFPPEYPVREIISGTVAAIGLIMLIATLWRLFRRGNKRRAITFSGMHGPVSIELEHVESTLENVAAKLPEVKKMVISLEPTDSPGRVRLVANGVLTKNADDDARMVTARVQHYLQQHTKKILGVQDVDVDLVVNKFLMNMRSVKPEPLMLEAPTEQTADVVPFEAPSDADPEIEDAVEDQATEISAEETHDEYELERKTSL